MKRSFYSLFLLVMLLPSILASQTITGKLIDQNGNGLSGLQLKLYISPKTYDATSITGGLFTFNNITEVKKDDELPAGYSVSENYPNPFNPKTRIVITLPNSGRVQVSMFNTLGQKVLEDIEKYYGAGTSSIDLELNGLSNGIYFARIILDGRYTVTKKLMLMYGSQHLSTSGSSNSSFSGPNKSTVGSNSTLSTKIDSIVVTGTSISRKAFTNLPSMVGSSLNLGSLAVSGTPGRIEIGLPVDVSTTAIGTGGGTIKVSKPGTPIDGMEITIPLNSFTTAKTFKISYAEIKSHQFSQYFNPISPMISVTYEGGYSNDGMSVKIPIKLPVGHFAMGFLYDDKTGKLEGMPIESLDNNFITVNTRSFSTASAQLNKTAGTSNATSIGNMIISSISETILKGQTIISSGFTPGVDDWEFINKGSYIAPIGHCAGQSMTAMWYFYEKKLNGAKPLFHLFDKVNNKNNPNLLWQDNPLGYRFASTIQKDFGFSGWINQITLRSNIPSLVWQAFAVSMLLTGEPQFVLIRNSRGEGGHAMIVYKINLIENKLYIADPNYPNNIDPKTNTVSVKTIDFVNGKFNSYFTGLSSDSPGIEMDQISYFGKTAYIDWGQIGKRWTELGNKTIGNDLFPTYTLRMKDGVNNIDFKDGYILGKDTLNIWSKSFDCEAELDVSFGTNIEPLIIYDTTGTKLADNNSSGIATIKLKPGANKFGLYMEGLRLNGTAHFLDFKWVTINYIVLSISPNPLKGEIGKDYKFSAITKKTAPASAKFIWSFGDNTPQITKLNDSTVTHTFTKEGNYTVKVELYDNSNNTKLAEATSSAQIVLGNPAPCPGLPTVTYAGKTYNTVQIGTQCWLKENLDVGTRVNGNTSQTNNSTIEKFCYNDDPANCSIYGGLYQWNEAMKYSRSEGTQGICPTGWHVPTYAELQTLSTATVVGNNSNTLKAIGQGTESGRGTNTSGFSALLAGYRYLASGFGTLGLYTWFWSSTEGSITSRVYFMILWSIDSGIRFTDSYKDYGLSVRCLKD